MYLKAQKIDLMKSDVPYWYGFTNSGYQNTLLINNLVVINSEADSKVEPSANGEWVVYNYIYTNLAEGLEKEVSR